jgi:hypothetical protein
VIGETRSGSSFRGLTHYLLHGTREQPKTPEWVELRNLLTADPERAWVDMDATATQNSRVRGPVFHIMVSPAPGDELTREDWRAVTDRILGDLGLGEHQVLVALHGDTGLPHLHLAVNRVHPETLRAWGTWRSKTRLEAILRKVEREWGLRVVPGRLAETDRAPEGRATPPLTPGEQAQLHHRATEPQVLAWRRELRGAFEEAGSWTDLAARLQVNGVHLVARGRGLVLSDGESFVKLSRLDRAYSRARLEARFGQPFADWRKEVGQFQEAARLYPRYAARALHDRRAGAALRTLQRTGRSLGWRPLLRLHGPLPPAASSAALAARRRARVLEGEHANDWDVFARRHLRPALVRAASWAEAESRLALYGAWLAPEGGRSRGLVVTDGRHATPIAGLDPRCRTERLEERLGPWSEWARSRRALLAAARRYHRVETSGDAAAVRWRRLTDLIEASERRLSEYDRLRDEYRRAEGRLRGLLRRQVGGSESAVQELLRAVRSAPVERVDGVVTSAGRWRPRLRRSRSGTREVVLEAARAYRTLVERVGRAAPPARSAARRLDRLRRQARLRNPHRLRQEQRQILLAAVRPLLGSGLRSLLARAAPGLGTALTVARLLGRLHRDLSRDEDRSRG